MEAKIDWQFGAKGASGRAHFERGQDAFVIFDGEEIGRIPAAELEAILRENIWPDGRANRLVERVQSIMQGEIYSQDVTSGRGPLQTWIAANSLG